MPALPDGAAAGLAQNFSVEVAATSLDSQQSLVAAAFEILLSDPMGGRFFTRADLIETALIEAAEITPIHDDGTRGTTYRAFVISGGDGECPRYGPPSTADLPHVLPCHVVTAINIDDMTLTRYLEIETVPAQGN